jgi:hypothetical protein
MLADRGLMAAIIGTRAAASLPDPRQADEKVFLSKTDHYNQWVTVDGSRVRWLP